MNQQMGIIVVFSGISVILVSFLILGIIDNHFRARYEKMKKQGGLSTRKKLATA